MPTYNNDKTLGRVLDQVLNFTNDLIVVNDGSTDKTERILSNYSDIDIVHLETNKGKGNALNVGFKRALERGFDYAITLDSDGQHFADDIPVFIHELVEHKKKSDPKELLLVGSRRMDGPSVPVKSSYGNRCSTYWFAVVTGVNLQDTQCGFRLYPLNAIKRMHLITSKFEFEIEVLVRAVWKGVEVRNIPVKVLYDPEERVTHFRPFQDVSRITLLNILFVVMAFGYYRPKAFLNRWFGKSRKQKKPFSDSQIHLD